MTFDFKLSGPVNWWHVTGVALIAGVVVFLAGELLDWRWESSLRQTRCTVVSAKTEGRVQIVGSGRRRRESSGRWVEDTTVEFQVDGVGRLRTVQYSKDFPVGQVRDCWVAGDQLSLDPAFERFLRRVDNGQSAIAALAAIFMGWALWRALKNSGLEWPF